MLRFWAALITWRPPIQFRLWQPLDDRFPAITRRAKRLAVGQQALTKAADALPAFDVGDLTMKTVATDRHQDSAS
jgi:hypothetical protein